VLTRDRQLYTLLRDGFALVDGFSRSLGAALRRAVLDFPAAITRSTTGWLMRQIDGLLGKAFGLTKAAALTSELFGAILTSTDRGALRPFEALWQRMERAVERKGAGLWGRVKAGMLRQGLESNDPLARTLARFEADRQAFARSGKLDANRRWVEGDGTRYRLSDRIWRQGQKVRREIDRTVREGIKAGQTPDQIARRIERYVAPGQEGQAARHARLLVQAETAHVYHEAEKQAAEIAPDVVGLRWVLSASHSYDDECNDYAEDESDGLGPGGYRPRNVPEMPHPRCACRRALIFREDLRLGDYLIEKYGGTM